MTNQVNSIALLRRRGGLKSLRLGFIVSMLLTVGAVLASISYSTGAESQLTATEAVMKSHGLREGIVWIGDKEPSEVESEELLSQVINHLREPEWTGNLEHFLKDHPDSPWAASLHYDYASFCRRTGRTTKALDHFEAAWNSTKYDQSPAGRRLSGTILANWTDLLSSLGRLEQLKELVTIGDRWTFVNASDRDKFQGAKHSYLLMQAHPEMAFRCGTFALKAVGAVMQPTNRALESLVEVPSPTNGFSIAELLDLANKHGLDLVAVRRTAGQDLIVPSVVHWRQNHYAAILGKRDEFYRVSDPTFGKDVWMPAEVINQEASGEFLIPAGSLSTGWTQLALNEARKIHGMGMPNNIKDDKDKGCKPGCPCPPCQGMPIWWVSEPYINLWMADEPISYLTSRGEPFAFRLTFKQRDNVSSVSPEITSGGVENSWYSFIQIDDNTQCGGSCSVFLFTSDATLYLPNGGTVDYPQAGDNLGEPRYDSETRTTLQQQFPVIYPPGDPFAQAVPLSPGFDYGDNGIQIVHADGARDIYGYGIITNNVYGDYPRAQFYLTRRIDAHGNTTWFNYGETTNSIFALQTVVDCDGRTNTLQYTSGGLLSEVDNPYGQSAHFLFDSNGNLTNLVDAQGLSSSITYDSNNNPTALITPYGTTHFTLIDNGATYGYGNAGGDDNGLIDRSALVVDPVGATNLYIYRFDSQNVLSSSNYSSGVPTSTPLGTLDTGTGANAGSNNAVWFRNSYHWGPMQYGHLSTLNMSNFTSSDYLLARTQHWLHDTNELYLTEYLSAVQDPSPDGTTPGLLRFYDYQGKTYNDQAGTYALPSVTAWQLPDGSTYYEYALFDSFGNVTNNITTYTLANGSVGTRTNRFIYANNNYTNLFSDLPNGGDITLTNVFTVPNLLTKVIASDGNTVWSYGGFDSMVWSNNYQYDPFGGTNSTILYSSRVLPDHVTNGIQQVATFTYGSPLPQSDYFGIYRGNYQLGTTFTGYNKVISATSVAGLTTTNIYNANGFLARTIDLQIGRTNSFGYTTDGLIGAWTNELGLNLTFTWDNLLRPTSAQYPDGSYTSNLYTRLDLTGRRDRLGNFTHYGYDGARHLTSITNADNAVWQFDWCGCGALTATIDPLTNTISFNYDNQGNLTNESLPDGSALNYQYDLAARRTVASDGAGRALQFAYNNQGLVSSVSNAYGQAGSIVYDIRDRSINVTDANGVTVTNAYDLLDRIVSRTWPNNAVEKFGYSLQGLAFYTNQLSQVTGYGHDAALRLIARTNADNQVNQFAYDSAGDLLTLTDGNGNVTKWNYDQLGRATNKLDASNDVVFVFSYDADNRLTNRWTPVTSNTVYSYDAVGNLTHIAYQQSPAITYSYDPLNRLTNMVDASGTNAFTYSQIGQLLSETGPWPSDTVTYTYSQQLRASLNLSQPVGSWVQNYTYDAARRLTNLTSTAGSFGYSYFAPASLLPVSVTLPNSAYITNSYDNLARLLSTKLLNSSSGVLDAQSYAYDANNQRTQQVFTAGNFMNYTYDSIGQLRTALGTEPGGVTNRMHEQFGYGYDAAGNLQNQTNNGLARTYSVNLLNELYQINHSGTLTVAGTTTGPATNVTVNTSNAVLYVDNTFASTNQPIVNGQTNVFTAIAEDSIGRFDTNVSQAFFPTQDNKSYDLNGNMTGENGPLGRNFAYDNENQLIAVWVANTWSNNFTYDGLRRRRMRKEFTWTGSSWSETNEVRYIYDGALVIQERDGNNDPQLTYTRGNDLSGTLHGAGGAGGLLAMTQASGENGFYHADGSGNVTCLINSNQLVFAKAEYTPYGQFLSLCGPKASVNHYWFSSKEYDTNSGLYYFGRRYYEPDLQRWINRDPIGELGGINIFAYVGNNPLNTVDTYGLQVVECGPEDGKDGDGTPEVLKPERDQEEDRKAEDELQKQVYINTFGPQETSIGPSSSPMTKDELEKEIETPPPGLEPEPESKPAKNPKPCPTQRTPEENKEARQKWKNNKEEGRKNWEEKTGKPWPEDENGNPWPGHHDPALKEGGDPLKDVEPQNPNGPDPHNIPGEDGLTDYQRWGSLGPAARAANMGRTQEP